MIALSGRRKPAKDVAGYPIVLTASRAEISQYGGDPFKAFICTFPELLSRRALNVRYLVENENHGGAARFAPYGLRKVEAILSKEFGDDSVVVCHPDSLCEFVGRNTRLVCITSMDPIGLADVSTTYNSLIGFGGESLNAAEFKNLLEDPAIQKYRRVRVLLCEANERVRAKLQKAGVIGSEHPDAYVSHLADAVRIGGGGGS